MSQSPPLPASTSPANREAASFADEINSSSLAFIEQQFERYLENPDHVSAEWQDYFEKLAENESEAEWPKQIGPSFRPRSLFHVPAGTTSQSVLQERVDQLVRNFRVRGHIVAKFDPLQQARPDPPELHPELYRILPEDHSKNVSSNALPGSGIAPFKDLLSRLKNTYCRSIGVQYMHIDSLFARTWLQERMERVENRVQLSRESQIRILEKLTDAIVFEQFLQTKYTGAKTFSLEGAETLIPLLDLAIEQSADDGVKQIVIGMAHRGRLNVLANIMGKSPSAIFREFEDLDPERHLQSGDVKYHMGFSSDYVTRSGKEVHLSLCFNPSHLEYVNPVALGKTRSKQDRMGDRKRSQGTTILIHGDAAFAGEGVVQETLNLSELKGYRTGGTIHIIVNNQIGFTTNPSEGRACDYATDIAKMLQVPIFHVNGEDPEAVTQVVGLATEFRRKFHRDVVIDMYCYRTRGHNENDEPAFTQPAMYKKIRGRKSVRQAYLEHLLKLGEVTREEADQIKKTKKQHLEDGLEAARSSNYVHPEDRLNGLWDGYEGGEEAKMQDPETGVARSIIAETMRSLVTVPRDFTPHRTLERMLRARANMGEGDLPFDWASGELLAMATLAKEGARVRLTGQDCRRGTFSQRHAVLYDFENGLPYHSLHHLSDDQAPVEIINSPLSEAGVMGFEYGYSLDAPDALVMWEAQFGDFHNAAQVIIDQFISSAEDKWGRLSGLTLLLPHGFEGQGPEHSSARLERFLTLAAEDNMLIVQSTTPAQHFHCLRRQIHWRWRKPLVLMTPKSLLRHKGCVSDIKEFESGTFQRVLPDTEIKNPEKARHILLCSGKVYYDLYDRREADGHTDVPILRLEQLYPLPEKRLRKALEAYPSDIPLVWVQEEPENMGAWRYLFSNFGTHFDDHPFERVSRFASASPATGSKKAHEIEQDRLITAAFDRH